MAIFRARPSPFYVLDEVEAALDDINLGRLLELIAELRATSQLIVITHQKRTMEVADALYGVTMRGDGVTQVISQRLRDADATKLTINGGQAKGAWYFETSSAEKGYPVEAHYRLQNYWPAHATIHIDLKTKGVSAGSRLAYDDSLTLDFTTGAANIATVDDSTHQITVSSDGQPHGTYPVSLGAANTPTRRGIKVIMEKGKSICMSGPGYSECGVKYTQRLTYDGEYLHAAPWNTGNIGRADSSNGCTNMLTKDALTLYNFLEIGDVVMYPNASGGKMQLGQGYGDWNVPWGQWRTGGLVASH